MFALGLGGFRVTLVGPTLKLSKEGALTAPRGKPENFEEYSCVVAVMQMQFSCDPEGASDVLPASALPSPL